MKPYHCLAAAFLAAALAAPTATAQVARPHLISKGNLLVPTGNPSPIEVGDTRLYGFVESFTADVTYRDDTTSDVSGSALGVAADFRLSGGSASGGYSSTRSEQTFSDSAVKVEGTTTTLIGQFTHAFGENVMVALTGALIRWESRVSLAGLSGSAGNEYIDLQIGARRALSERLRIGGFFSPEVSSSDSLSGGLTGLEFRAGHGLTVEAGLGYRAAGGVALEGSVRNVQESEASLDPALLALRASAGWAVTELIVLDATLTRYERQQLDVDNEPFSPPSEGLVAVLGAFLNFDPSSDLVLGIQVLQERETASDTGDPAVDDERFDTFDGTLLELSLSGNF